MNKMRIRSISTLIPAAPVSQKELMEIACLASGANPRQKQVIKQLYRRTQIDRRPNIVFSKHSNNFPYDNNEKTPTTSERMRAYETNIVPLAVEACRDGLTKSEIAAGDITHLITVSCTGFKAPGFDFSIIKELGLSATVSRFHLGFMGCNGALNGINLARTILDADCSNKVMLCCAELCSLHYQYGWQSDDIVANSLFADGAACVVADSVSGEVEEPLSRVVSSASYLIPDSADEMTWTITDEGFKMTLSSCVPERVIEYLPAFLTGWLNELGMKRQDIKSFAVHPGGPRVLRAVQSGLKLEDKHLAPSREILKEYGNMSSSTVLFILSRLKDLGSEGPCLMLAFGPGLVIEACIIN